MTLSISPELAALWEERAHLKIQISLLEDQAKSDRVALSAARQRLATVEQMITAQKRLDNSDTKISVR